MNIIISEMGSDRGVAADSLPKQECSKREHGRINILQIENCLRDGHCNFRDGLKQR